MKKSLNLKYKSIEKEILKAKKILLLAHRAPDGDALSSVLSLNVYLKKKKKKVYIFLPQIPKFLNFLPFYQDAVKKLPKKFDFDLVIAVDYASDDRIEIPNNLEIPSKKIITIDHHLESSGRKIGKIKLIDSNASSVAEILYNFFKYLKINISKEMATILLTGVLTDTVGFSRTNQEHKKVEKVIAELILQGANLFKIMSHYHYLDYDRGKLLGKLFERAQRDEDLKLIYSYLKISDFSEKGLNLSEPPIFPDFLSQIGDAEIYIFLMEQKNNKLKCSLRSSMSAEIRSSAKWLNLAEIAGKFGGGGHRFAAGFKTKGTKEDVLKKIKKELKKIRK